MRMLERQRVQKIVQGVESHVHVLCLRWDLFRKATIDLTTRPG